MFVVANYVTAVQATHPETGTSERRRAKEVDWLEMYNVYIFMKFEAMQSFHHQLTTAQET